MPGKSESETPDVDDVVSAEAADAAAAAAEERAEAARIRASELRAKLEASRGGTPASSDSVNADEPDSSEPEAIDAIDAIDDEEPEAPSAGRSPEQKRRRRAPGLRTVAATLVVIVSAGLLGVTGWMVWEHRNVENQRHRSAEFAAAARQGVVNLMSLDYTHAQESVQRVIDDSTGKFKANFEDGSGDLIKALTDSKVATKVTVNESAVESMDKDTATVLVAATSQRIGPDAPKEDQQPRVWRVVVNLIREGDQLKMADVEFA